MTVALVFPTRTRFGGVQAAIVPAKMAHEQEPIPDRGTEVDRPSARIPTSDDASLSVKNIGQTLRSERERRGKQLDDVARAIKIRPNHLAAIEEGRFEELPSRGLMIAYVGRYARYLGLEIEKLPESEPESGPHDGRDIEQVSDPKFRVGNILAGLLLLGLTVILYGIILYWALYFVGLAAD